MPNIKQTSKPARTTLVLLVALLAAIAVHPASGIAAPLEEPQPQLAFEPGSYDFGVQGIDRGGNQANLQLRNEGAGEVHVDTLGIGGPDSEAFWVSYDNCSGQTLQPDQGCSVGVSFNPRAMTAYSAQLRASVGGYQFTAELSGSGGRPIVGVAPNPTDFGVAKVGSAGVTREIAVTNSGNLPAGFFIAVIAGGAVGSFQLLDENCTGHGLMPSTSCTLQVRFQPVSEGVKTAMLGLFGDGDAGGQVVLTGVGAAPEPVSASLAASDPGRAAADSASGPRLRPRSHRQRPRLRHRRSRINLHGARRVLSAKDPASSIIR